METRTAATLDPSRLLRTALEEKTRKNPAFSLRAFARASGISHTVLSLVLSGKRRMSRKAALQLAEYLELEPRRRNALLRHFVARGEKPPADARLFHNRLGIPMLAAKLAIERLERLGLISDGRPTGE